MEPMEVARSVAQAYTTAGDVAGVMVAGSLGRGDADHHSDIEIDCYWTSSPTDERRRRAVETAGGDLATLWPYEPAEGEWSEDFEVDGHAVTISGFSVAWMEQVIDRRHRFDLLEQLRLSALHEGQPLVGEEQVERWRQLATYSEELAVDTINHYLADTPLSSWRQWPALVERHDDVPLHDLCTRMINSMLGMLCGVNHVYVSHPRFKWTARLIQQFSRAPDDLQERLAAALNGSSADLGSTVNALFRETLIIARTVHPSDDLTEALESLLRTPPQRRA